MFSDLGVLACTLDDGIATRAALGLLVLATDQTMEHEFRHLIRLPGVAVYGARLFNDADITPETLRAMRDRIAPAAELILPGMHLDVVAFGCPSASMALGEAEVFRQIRRARPDVACTTPVTAAFAAFKALGARRIGVLTPYAPAVNAVVRPLVRVLAPLPKVALYPALLLLLGFGHGSKITLVAADALFPILLSTYYGASMVEQKLIWSAMAAGTPRGQILFKVVLPAAVPSILTGCRIGLVISCIVVFLAEMITSTDGLGHLLVTAARTFQAVDMFVPLITISLLGLILNGLLQAVRSYLLRGFPEV